MDCFARNDGKTSTQHTIVIPAKAGIQYAAAFRFYHFGLWNTGSPAFAPSRVTTTEYAFAFSRRISPEVCIFFWPSPIRGCREDRVLAAPAVPRAICANK